MPPALRTFAAAERIPVEEEFARLHQARALGEGVTSVPSRTAEQILEVAGAEEVEMIFLGSRGLSKPEARFLGSVSHKVADHAGCTCVTVKGAAHWIR
jgi:nucleotide-binding universal stress UspA family protein